jgi:hypothetical protein
LDAKSGFAYECHPAQKEGLLAQEMAASARFPLAKLPHCPPSDRNAVSAEHPLPRNDVILNAVKDLRLFWEFQVASLPSRPQYAQSIHRIVASILKVSQSRHISRQANPSRPLSIHE